MAAARLEGEAVAKKYAGPLIILGVLLTLLCDYLLILHYRILP
jgi:hypothetical protein